MAKTGVMDITLPFAALTASKNVSVMLEKVFGDYGKRQIEMVDLMITPDVKSFSFSD